MLKLMAYVDGSWLTHTEYLLHPAYSWGLEPWEEASVYVLC